MVSYNFKVFDKLKEKYTVVELDIRDDGEEIQGILGEITGARTVSVLANFNLFCGKHVKL